MKALRLGLAIALVGLLAPGSAHAADPEVGIASHYGPGTGVAMPFCTWTLRHSAGCGWVRIASHATGLVVEAPVIDFCLCRVPDSAHPARLVDLQYGVVAALGLDLDAGLYPVTLTRPAAAAPALPDTSVGPIDPEQDSLPASTPGGTP